MKCFLIGGNKDLLESIEAYLQANFFYMSTCERSNSYAEAEKLINKVKPDLVLLDSIGQEEDTYNFLKKIKKYAIETLAIIPEDQKMIDHLIKNNITYIIRPIDLNELRFCLNNLYVNRTKELELQQIIERIRTATPKKRIAIPQEKQIQMISTQDILYIEADINYCQVYILDKKPVFVSKTLKSFQQQLINNNEFYRIHQSYLINLNYISKVIKTKLLQVVMTNGDILTASRSKKTEFLKLILG